MAVAAAGTMGAGAGAGGAAGGAAETVAGATGAGGVGSLGWAFAGAPAAVGARPSASKPPTHAARIDRRRAHEDCLIRLGLPFLWSFASIDEDARRGETHHLTERWKKRFCLTRRVARVSSGPAAQSSSRSFVSPVVGRCLSAKQ